MIKKSVIITIIILTCNRKKVLAELLSELTQFKRPDIEIIVVDNGSNDGTIEMIKEQFPHFRTISLEANYGAVARNEGIRIAKGHCIVTLDDDILGFNEDAINYLIEVFEDCNKIGAICFKVKDFYTGQVCNWCHPKKVEEFSHLTFETTGITEGAVAFRKEVLQKTGLYPSEFFISHEGSDLAMRIINAGYQILYNPNIIVKHKYSRQNRKEWRRYYYDTRNDFWLACRNYSLIFGLSHMIKRLPVTFIYCLRDGYLKYWFKAVKDGLLRLPEISKQRNKISADAQKHIRKINKEKPGILYYIQKRLFSKQIKI